MWRSKFSSSARWFHIWNFSFPGWKLSTASCRTSPALNHERGCSLMIQIILALLLKWNIFWWIMQCQPSPHRTHLNKCRFEILKDEASVSEWFTTPCKCSVISSRSLSKKYSVKFKKHSRKTRPSPLTLIPFFMLAVTTHIARSGALLTGGNEPNGDAFCLYMLSWLLCNQSAVDKVLIFSICVTSKRILNIGGFGCILARVRDAKKKWG